DQYGGTWNQAYTDLRYDWTHVNALVFDDDAEAIYISTRHLSRITKIDYPSGEIIWNMGHQLLSSDVDMGTELGFSFQHSLQILTNGNILTFDNGNLSHLPEFLGTDEPISRAIEIAVNESGSNCTAELAWAYELPLELFGFASGNTQKLNNGNVLVTTVGGGGRSLEINENGDIVWEAEYNLSLPNGAVYRAHRISGLYPAAFSILINNYQEYEGIEGVYLPEGISNITFTLIHEGGYPDTFFYEIRDDAGWFNAASESVFLQPGQETGLTFSGNIAASANGNPITITVTPAHHPEESKSVTVTGFTNPLTGTAPDIPGEFELKQPFPNPFNSSTTIRYSSETPGPVSLQIFDITGRLMATLTDGNPGSGFQEIKWNAGNHPAGLYFVKLTGNDQIETKKIIYLK
ncbi:MAG: aryl-sulfate sulfotransferase, partial [Candidatus Neomarinimicrobiota bacterium]|nr:aryl-sulfate sulfotransferase [Candidatus Neomarinimicrobiota bacterium]